MNDSSSAASGLSIYARDAEKSLVYKRDADGQFYIGTACLNNTDGYPLTMRFVPCEKPMNVNTLKIIDDFYGVAVSVEGDGFLSKNMLPIEFSTLEVQKTSRKKARLLDDFLTETGSSSGSAHHTGQDRPSVEEFLKNRGEPSEVLQVD